MKKTIANSMLYLSMGLMVILSPSSAFADPAISTWAVSSSSTLYEEGYDNGPWCIEDNDLSTAWAEGVDGHGYGEYLNINIPPYTVITGGTIYPGFYASEDLFYKNNAPRTLYMRTGTQEAYLDVTKYADTYQGDHWGGYHFTFNEPLVASDGILQVTIISIREGWLYDDTCITELHLEGYQATAATAPVSDDPNPHVSVNEEVTTGEEIFNHPDGLGSDGLGPDEKQYSDDAEFLDSNTQQRLASFASQIYKLHCHTQEASPLTVDKDDLYSYSRAYLLHWYQYNIPDSRISSEGEYNYAYDYDLSDILEELFQNASPADDLQTFYDNFANAKKGNYIRMYGTGDFGDAGYYYFSLPVSTSLSVDDRILIKGDVMTYNEESGQYIGALSYAAYFIQDINDPDVFRFDELIVGSSGTMPEQSYSYTTQGLILLAKEYCRKHNGLTPQECDIYSNSDGTINMHLYDIVYDHTATYAWFNNVDEYGNGYDSINNRYISLAE